MSKPVKVFNKEKILLLEELENYRNEVGALRRAVDSKTAAVTILHLELKECQSERDKFRMIAENNKPICQSHPLSAESTKPAILSERNHSAILSGSEGTLAQLLSKSKEENKQLHLQVTDLRCRLHDALSDLKVLREQKSLNSDINRGRVSSTTSSQLAQEERETLLQQLEVLSARCQALEGDLRNLLEEREELIKERDETKHKLHRLNYILNVLLSQHEAMETMDRVIDLDAIIAENRYLQSRLKQLKEETFLTSDNATKHKSVLDKSNHRSSDGRIGTCEHNIINSKQVFEFLKECKGEIKEYDGRDLRSLLITLVDSLSQNSQVIKSQKAANRMLANRIEELERRLHPYDKRIDVETSSSLISSSLMENYVPPSGTHLDLDNGLQEQTLHKLLQTKCKIKKYEPNCSIADHENTNIVDLATNCKAKIEVSDDRVDEPVMKFQNATEGISNNICPVKSINQDKLEMQSKKIENVAKQYAENKTCEKSSSGDSDLEEVIPVENLDSYIKNLRLQRSSKNTDNKDSSKVDIEKSCEENCLEKAHAHYGRPQNPLNKKYTEVKYDDDNESSESSFILNASDYESDDGNLEKTLQNWQSEFENNPRSPKTSKLWKFEESSVDIPNDLKEILQ